MDGLMQGTVDVEQVRTMITPEGRLRVMGYLLPPQHLATPVMIDPWMPPYYLPPDPGDDFSMGNFTLF
jgi:hypothetical protein